MRRKLSTRKWKTTNDRETHRITQIDLFLHFWWLAQITGAMSSGRLNFILWRLMLSVLKMELASRFPAVFQKNVVAPRLLQKIVHPYPNIN